MGGECFSVVAKAAEAALRCRDLLDVGEVGAAALAYRDFHVALRDVRAVVAGAPRRNAGDAVLHAYADELVQEEQRLAARLHAGGIQTSSL